MTLVVVNLVRVLPSGKFSAVDAILGAMVTSHTHTECNEPAKIGENY